MPHTIVFDPVLSSSEKKILHELKFQTSEENLEGCYLVNNSVSNLTVFYLPHCPKQLLNNILWTNWDRLDRILILGNSISGISTNLLKKQLESLKYIQSASEFCHGKNLLHPSLDIVNEPIRTVLFTISSHSLYQGIVKNKIFKFLLYTFSIYTSANP